MPSAQFRQVRRFGGLIQGRLMEGWRRSPETVDSAGKGAISAPDLQKVVIGPEFVENSLENPTVVSHQGVDNQKVTTQFRNDRVVVGQVIKNLCFYSSNHVAAGYVRSLIRANTESP
jgi:hypothetical protein